MELQYGDVKPIKEGGIRGYYEGVTLSQWKLCLDSQEIMPDPKVNI